MTYADLIALLTKRRSVRYFGTKALEKETLEKILAAGRLAPSIENIQPWHFHVIRNPQLKAKLMETSCYGNFVVGSGVFIVISCDRTTGTKTQNTIWNPCEMEYSCTAAILSMMLAAATMDIGSCWVSLHHGPAHEILKLKENQTIVAGLMLGHMKPGEEEASREHQREPMQKMVTMYE